MVVSAAAVSAIPDTDANLQTAPPAATNSDIDFKKLGNFLTCLSKETQEPKVPLPVGDSLTGVLALNKCVLESYGPLISQKDDYI
ncbi:hypothetical protein BC941DRAFT_472789 [Chlamydoabsidia padenii]|nr:hypothetical protein BC941DRAFT_472789 [Chlamydoabsidia padenii]